MARKDLKRLIDRIDSLPSLPGVVVSLIRLTQDDEADASAVAQVIESDQALTAQILRLVNSPTYNFSSPITTVPRAVAAAGFNTIRAIALGIGVVKAFPRPKQDDVLPMDEFWKHCLACAVCADLLARHSRHDVDNDEAFVAALLHDLGKLVLKTCFPGEYDSAVSLARNGDVSLLEAEQQTLSISHCDAGKWLAERWGLPELYVRAIWLHHQPVESLNLSTQDPVMVAIVQAADALARQFMIGYSGSEEYTRLREAQFDAVGVKPTVVDDIRPLVVKRVEDYATVVDMEISEIELYLESLNRANQTLSRMSINAERHNRQLALQTKRLRAMADMNQQLGADQTLDQVLKMVAHCLRDGFEAKTGLCYVADPGQHSIWGKSWHEGGPIRDFEVAADQSGMAAVEGSAGLDGAVRAVLSETALQFAVDAWAGQHFDEVFRRNGLLVVPMLAGGRSRGQILLDLRIQENAPNLDNGTHDLMHFAAAAGIAVARVERSESIKQQSEEMATAMWKLEQAHRQLLHSERLAAVGKMAAGAAHEINNPLAIISGRAQMMLQKEEDTAREKQLRIIVEQCQRASKILNDLMGFARPAMPKKEITGINGVIFKVLEMFESRFERHGITLRREFAPELPKVMVDQGQIEQVLVNLLINAEHAIMPPGEVHVATSLGRSGKDIVINLSDTGAGIPPEQLAHIFEPFFTTKEEGKGTGLGLSLAHGIITSHQGSINVRSEIGKGTTFTITLPAADDVERVHSARGRGAKAQTFPKASHRILVVDDEEHVRAVISDAFSTLGYEVIQAANGLDAIEMLQHTPVELVTLDIRMPRMDGMSLLRALRQHGPKVPVLVVTGLASDEEIEAARQLGVYACIRKPFQVDQLLEEAMRALKGRPSTFSGNASSLGVANGDT